MLFDILMIISFQLERSMLSASSRLEIAEAELLKHHRDLRRIQEEVSQKAERADLQPLVHSSRVDELDDLIKTKQDKMEYISRDSEVERKVKVGLLNIG